MNDREGTEDSVGRMVGMPQQTSKYGGDGTAESKGRMVRMVQYTAVGGEDGGADRSEW